MGSGARGAGVPLALAITNNAMQNFGTVLVPGVLMGRPDPSCVHRHRGRRPPKQVRDGGGQGKEGRGGMERSEKEWVVQIRPKGGMFGEAAHEHFCCCELW